MEKQGRSLQSTATGFGSPTHLFMTRPWYSTRPVFLLMSAVVVPMWMPARQRSARPLAARALVVLAAGAPTTPGMPLGRICGGAGLGGREEGLRGPWSLR